MASALNAVMNMLTRRGITGIPWLHHGLISRIFPRVQRKWRLRSVLQGWRDPVGGLLLLYAPRLSVMHPVQEPL